MHVLRITTSLLVLFATLPASALQTEEGPLPTQRYEGIPFVTGGVGLEEREQISRDARAYNLKLIFTENGGDYLGDVKVSIAKPGGSTVFEAVSDGPVLLARLPNGTYRVSVSAAGKDQVRTTHVASNGQQTLIFRW